MFTIFFCLSVDRQYVQALRVHKLSRKRQCQFSVEMENDNASGSDESWSDVDGDQGVAFDHEDLLMEDNSGNRDLVSINVDVLSYYF